MTKIFKKAWKGIKKGARATGRLASKAGRAVVKGTKSAYGTALKARKHVIKARKIHAGGVQGLKDSANKALEKEKARIAKDFSDV